MAGLKMECFKLVHSMLENSDERAKKMQVEFNDTLDLAQLKDLMFSYQSMHDTVCGRVFIHINFCQGLK
jgi:hypothetical protein